jgi:hypothetical protein
MQHFLNLFIFTHALHVSGGFSAHHQEHKTVQAASGNVKPILLPAAIATGSSIGLKIPDAVCTVLCS